jgi:hypothetical protein
LTDDWRWQGESAPPQLRALKKLLSRLSELLPLVLIIWPVADLDEASG